MPTVKIAVMVVHDGKMLMGLRNIKYAGRKWCFPSLCLKNNQDFDSCAKRAVSEQAGLAVRPGNVMHTTNDVYRGLYPRHEVSVYMDADMLNPSDTPVAPEESSYIEWKWFPLFHPPEPLDSSEHNFFNEHFICISEPDDLDYEIFGGDV